jgi:chitosanase
MTTTQQATTLKVLSVFETGKTTGGYDNVTILKDKNYLDGNIDQITFGKYQTTEESNLKSLLEMYIKVGSIYALTIKNFLKSINTVNGKKEATIWASSDYIVEILELSGKDPIMTTVQDAFFKQYYLDPADNFAKVNGFILPLSILVIRDSYIHSGSVKDYLRKRFPERVPKKGGNERAWVKAYVKTRHEWLSNHENEILKRTNYRTKTFLNEIERGNWMIDMPIVANGVEIN